MKRFLWIIMGLALAPAAAEAGQPQLADDWATAVREDDRRTINRLFDHVAMSEEVFRGLDSLTPMDRVVIRRDMASWPLALATQVRAELAEGGSFEPTGASVPGAGPVVRQISPYTLNYQTLLLSDDGERVRDVHLLLSGRPLSELPRTNLKAAIEAGDGGMPRWHRALDEMAAAKNLGRWDEVLRLFEDEPVKDVPQAHTSRIDAAFALSDGEAMDAAIADADLVLPEATVALWVWDFELNRGEFMRAMDYVDRLDEAVGGDPYLDALRARIFAAAGDEELALARAEAAVAACPGLEQAWVTLGDVAFEFGRHETAARALDVLVREHDYSLAFLHNDDWFDDFLASPDYRRLRDALDRDGLAPVPAGEATATGGIG